MTKRMRVYAVVSVPIKRMGSRARKALECTLDEYFATMAVHSYYTIYRHFSLLYEQ